MNPTLKATLVQFIPGPKAVTIALTSLMLFLDHWLKLGINEAKVVAASVTIGAYLITHTNSWGDLLKGSYWAQFIPGPKVLAMMITPVLVMADHKFQLGIPVNKIGALAATISLYLLTHLKKPGTAVWDVASGAPKPPAPGPESVAAPVPEPAKPSVVTGGDPGPSSPTSGQAT